jgi:hypothetical protein
MQEGVKLASQKSMRAEGTPRYLKGKLPSEKPESWRIVCFKLSPTPPKYIKDFDALI